METPDNSTTVKAASRVKYPRTFHLPWSEGATDDDKILKSVKHFCDLDEVVITEKMDGENTSIYRDFFHARSLDLAKHPSRDHINKLRSEKLYDLPLNMRVCGENCFAKHSIAYDSLEDLFLVFSIWKDDTTCLSWDETVEWCELLDLKTVPVLYRGKFDEELIRNTILVERESMEGYVIRNAASYQYESFAKNVAKYVRKNHVQTNEHWLNQPIVPNKVKDTL